VWVVVFADCSLGGLDPGCGYFKDFPTAPARLAVEEPGDLLGIPAYRFWFLVRCGTAKLEGPRLGHSKHLEVSRGIGRERPSISWVPTREVPVKPSEFGRMLRRGVQELDQAAPPEW